MHWEEISAVFVMFQEKDGDSGLLMTQVVDYHRNVPQILAIETTHPRASVALLKEDGTTVEREFESHRQQNQKIFEPLKDLLEEIQKEEEVQGIDYILVGTGPGSYSGARIAIALAQGLGIVYGTQVVGLSSFYGLEALATREQVTVVGDARRGSYFATEIRAHHLIEKPELLSQEALLMKLEKSTGSLVTMESQRDLSEDLPGNYEICRVHPKASCLIRAWLNFESDIQDNLKKEPVAPAYLRAPFITKAKEGHPLLRGKKA